MRYAYYDRDADIAWFPTGDSDDVVSERIPGGLRDYDRATREVVALEIWDASTRLPASPSTRSDARNAVTVLEDLEAAGVDGYLATTVRCVSSAWLA